MVEFFEVTSSIIIGLNFSTLIKKPKLESLGIDVRTKKGKNVPVKWKTLAKYLHTKSQPLMTSTTAVQLSIRFA